MPDKQQKWYQNWFNSPYYHILYNKRDEREAEHLMDNLCEYLTPSTQERMLDVGCGKGRHAIYLNKKGYDVTGIDLSQENIKHASAFENAKLHFYVHDMRNLFFINYFDIVFNLFTSFGFFEKERDHQHAINMFAHSLKKDGALVLDFMNAEKLQNNLVFRETQLVGLIEFHIQRKLENGFIVKKIDFEDKGRHFAFKEEVRALMPDDFKRFFTKAGLEIEATFGDYDLNEFDPKISDRLIFVCRKK
ncbi:class I SAM-dependent methyltransferase [Solitalea canadensis]|uniref:Methyltransferase family protein n=1 Tax=Solitalea canadensis (strain ATCC 29591 / DSM 3403 / JCM 21819 / LMG 8368 / NBRC 15130 / NCIMB 12057 / USAM 9D) TaxID=929556 RepID=H8KRA5_SOLCM|nr:class I SAM-dependent methyltransferase [Solitalea canadensis]AFD07372.1 methyltransferase family protein [Solitalea canadensis DSM 3403]